MVGITPEQYAERKRARRKVVKVPVKCLDCGTPFDETKFTTNNGRFVSYCKLCMRERSKMNYYKKKSRKV